MGSWRDWLQSPKSIGYTVPNAPKLTIAVDDLPATFAQLRHHSATCGCFCKASEETQKTVLDWFKQKGIEKVAICGFGVDRILFYVGGPLVLSFSYIGPRTIPDTGIVSPLIMQPLTHQEVAGLPDRNSPHFQFDLLPFGLPLNAAQTGGLDEHAYPDKISHSFDRALARNTLVREVDDMLPRNLGYLLTGSQVVLDKGCLGLKQGMKSPSLESFWRHGNTDQHQHVKMLGLEYGRWPAEWIGKDPCIPTQQEIEATRSATAKQTQISR